MRLFKYLQREWFYNLLCEPFSFALDEADEIILGLDRLRPYAGPLLEPKKTPKPEAAAQPKRKSSYTLKEFGELEEAS